MQPDMISHRLKRAVSFAVHFLKPCVIEHGSDWTVHLYSSLVILSTKKFCYEHQEILLIRSGEEESNPSDVNQSLSAELIWKHRRPLVVARFCAIVSRAIPKHALNEGVWR